MAKTKKPRAATPKEREFVVEYIWGEDAGNGGACAEKVGFCHDRASARRYAHTLLRRPHIAALRDAEATEKERQLKAKAVLAAEEIFTLARADIGDAFDENGKLLPVCDGITDGKGGILRMPASIRRAISSIEVETRQEGHGEDAESYTVTKIKLHDKGINAERILKFAGKLKDKLEIESQEPISITINGISRG